MNMNSMMPPTTVLDSTTGRIVDINQYMDANGNITAPPGYSFVAANVQIPQTMPVPITPMMQPSPMHHIQPSPMQRMQPSPMNYYSAQQAIDMDYWSAMAQPSPMNAGHYTPRGQRQPKRTPKKKQLTPKQSPKKKPVSKLQFTHLVAEMLKTAAISQKIWVDRRSEDHGKYTLRIHSKRRRDLEFLPFVVQKVISEIGMDEFSMHWLKKQQGSCIHGITIYMKFEAGDKINQAKSVFDLFEIKAKVVGKSNQNVNAGRSLDETVKKASANPKVSISLTSMVAPVPKAAPAVSLGGATVKPIRPQITQPRQLSIEAPIFKTKRSLSRSISLPDILDKKEDREKSTSTLIMIPNETYEKMAQINSWPAKSSPVKKSLTEIFKEGGQKLKIDFGNGRESIELKMNGNSSFNEEDLERLQISAKTTLEGKRSKSE